MCLCFLYFFSFDALSWKKGVLVEFQFLLVKFQLLPAFSPFYTPVKDGTYYVITRGAREGGVPHSLSKAHLQDYASYGNETSWVDRSHQGGMQCTGTITPACLIF